MQRWTRSTGPRASAAATSAGVRYAVRREPGQAEADMSDFTDLFPGFASHWIDTQAGRIFARSGGEGPPLVLLHGFPQSHAMWHRVAPVLARRFHVVAMDLRGYGWSSAPESEAGADYTKRRMGEDVIA